MKEQLFNEFNAVSASEWKQKIQVDLKGADYNDTLLWKTNEGIEVKPFYNQDDARSSRTAIKKKAFKICETITVTDRVHHANKKAKIALDKGTEVLKFNINSPIDMRELLDGIPVAVHFNFNFLELDYFKRLFAVLREKPQQYFLNIDPIHQLASTGNWFHNITEDFDITAKLLHNKPNNVTLLATTISGYQNAGANSIQQVAYGLSHANEYLNRFGSLASDSMQFQLAIGSNYFFEIAKIKALKLLMTSLNKEYNATAAPDIIIFCTPTKRNKTLYDYNVNMLRTTTECMSAILGGADTVNNLAYDSIYHKTNEFGERISRNQLQILKAESYFDKVANPAEGAYYIESLTKQIAKKALNIFKEIEASGGFLKQLKVGTIQRKIKEAAAKEQEQFDAGDLVLLGTNKYPNPEDFMKQELEINPFLEQQKRKTLIAPVIEKRLAESLEQKRLKNE